MTSNAKDIEYYKKLYPNLDFLMIETILKMSDDEHEKFQEGLESGELQSAPEKFIYEDAIEVINDAEAEGQTDV